MRDLPSGMTAHARQLREEHPFIWLYEFAVPTEPDASRFRITNARTAVSFGQTSSGTPLVYSPFPVTHSEIRETAAGDLVQFSIQVGNPSLFLAAIMEEHDGLKGRACVVRLVDSLHLDNPAAQIRFDMEVIDPTFMNEKLLQVTLGKYNVTQLSSPPHKYTRHVCGSRVEYKGVLCGYVGSLATCDRSLDGPNGCTMHGDDEVANGLPRQHPERFGGRHAIPFQRGS